jgi:hypothetical protein
MRGWKNRVVNMAAELTAAGRWNCYDQPVNVLRAVPEQRIIFV